eukprot:Nitzschia sp. Nitz4//scaffold38_size140716//87925//88476//NITZ4_003150-RA/size140716-processed-gene-0.72-mRNA-1//-1//CDS//3329550087//4283//frame0
MSSRAGANRDGDGSGYWRCLNRTAIVVIITGIVGSLSYYFTRPEYVATNMGQPTRAVACVGEEELSRKEHEICENYPVPHWNSDQCRLVLSYIFTTDTGSGEMVYTGMGPGLAGCSDEELESAIESYMSSENLTIYYVVTDPDTNQHDNPPNYKGGAVMIGGIFGGTGLILLLTGCLGQMVKF